MVQQIPGRQAPGRRPQRRSRGSLFGVGCSPPSHAACHLPPAICPPGRPAASGPRAATLRPRPPFRHRLQPPASGLRPDSRRGVLLLVVLSLLVLFAMIAVTFVLVAGKYSACRAAGKTELVGDDPQKQLDDAFGQVVRGTLDPNSSLLPTGSAQRPVRPRRAEAGQRVHDDGLGRSPGGQFIDLARDALPRSPSRRTRSPISWRAAQPDSNARLLQRLRADGARRRGQGPQHPDRRLGLRRHLQLHDPHHGVPRA